MGAECWLVLDEFLQGSHPGSWRAHRSAHCDAASSLLLLHLVHDVRPAPPVPQHQALVGRDVPERGAYPWYHLRVRKTADMEPCASHEHELLSLVRPFTAGR